MICHQCGHSEIDGSAFCSGCGGAMFSAFANGSGSPSSSQADLAFVGRNCPYCRFPLKPAGQVTECASCHAVHHADCWSENHRCAVMGCAGAPAEAVAAAPVAGAVPAPPPYAGMDQEYTPAPFPNTTYSSSNAGDNGSWYLKTAAIVGGVVLALGGAGGAVVVASSSDSETQEPARTESVMAPEPGDDSTDGGTADGSSDAPSEPVEEGADTFQGDGYTVNPPDGWIQVLADKDKGGFTESRWHAPGSDSIYVLVDRTADYSGTAHSGARNVRASVRRASDYVEYSYRPNGDDGWLWEFAYDGAQKIDIFTTACGDGLAALGSAPAAKFEHYRNQFSEFADSLTPDCEAPAASSTATDGETRQP